MGVIASICPQGIGDLRPCWPWQTAHGQGAMGQDELSRLADDLQFCLSYLDYLDYCVCCLVYSPLTGYSNHSTPSHVPPSCLSPTPTHNVFLFIKHLRRADQRVAAKLSCTLQNYHKTILPPQPSNCNLNLQQLLPHKQPKPTDCKYVTSCGQGHRMPIHIFFGGSHLKWRGRRLWNSNGTCTGPCERWLAGCDLTFCVSAEISKLAVAPIFPPWRRHRHAMHTHTHSTHINTHGNKGKIADNWFSIWWLLHTFDMRPKVGKG